MFFKEDNPVRIVTFEPDGIPHFVLPDLLAAMGLHDCAGSAVNRPSFPAHAKRVVDITADKGTGPVTVLTPVGVWYLTESVDRRRGERLASWSKREALRLCPQPRPSDPAMFLRIHDDGELPPRPNKYSGRRAEWYALKDSPEYRDGYSARREARGERFLEHAAFMEGIEAALAAVTKEVNAGRAARKKVVN